MEGTAEARPTIGAAVAIKKFFAPDASALEFAKEYRALTAADRIELGTACAEELGYTLKEA